MRARTRWRGIVQVVHLPRVREAIALESERVGLDRELAGVPESMRVESLAVIAARRRAFHGELAGALPAVDIAVLNRERLVDDETCANHHREVLEGLAAVAYDAALDLPRPRQRWLARTGPDHHQQRQRSHPAILS